MEMVTSEGLARAEIDWPPGVNPAGPAARWRPRFLLVLTHGAGGDAGSPDLLAVAAAGLRIGGMVARVTQPYRVRGRRAPGSPARQDAAWVETVAALRAVIERHLSPLGVAVASPGQARLAAGQRPAYPAIPLIQGGRSNGARVACRTAAATGAQAVIALAFPLHPPGRPDRSRAAELRAAGTPVLVINGDRDPFGVPDPADADRVIVLAGESHALSRDPVAVGSAAGAWLRELTGF